MTEICMFCKGKLQKGLHEFIARIDDQIVVIKDLPAMICNQCDEAYFDETVMEKLDIIRERFSTGNYVAHPIAAGELTISEI